MIFNKQPASSASLWFAKIYSYIEMITDCRKKKVLAIASISCILFYTKSITLKLNECQIKTCLWLFVTVFWSELIVIMRILIKTINIIKLIQIKQNKKLELENLLIVPIIIVIIMIFNN